MGTTGCLAVFLLGVLIGVGLANNLLESAVFLYEQFKRKEQNG